MCEFLKLFFANLGKRMHTHVITVDCSGGAYLDSPDMTAYTYYVRRGTSFTLKINVPDEYYKLTSSDVEIDSNNCMVIDSVRSDMHIRVMASDTREVYNVAGTISNVEDLEPWPQTVRSGNSLNFEFKAIEGHHIDYYGAIVGDTPVSPTNVEEIKDGEYITQVRFSIENIFGDVNFTVRAIPDYTTLIITPSSENILKTSLVDPQSVSDLTNNYEYHAKLSDGLDFYLILPEEYRYTYINAYFDDGNIANYFLNVKDEKTITIDNELYYVKHMAYQHNTGWGYYSSLVIDVDFQEKNKMSIKYVDPTNSNCIVFENNVNGIESTSSVLNINDGDIWNAKVKIDPEYAVTHKLHFVSMEWMTSDSIDLPSYTISDDSQTITFESTIINANLVITLFPCPKEDANLVITIKNNLDKDVQFNLPTFDDTRLANFAYRNFVDGNENWNKFDVSRIEKVIPAGSSMSIYAIEQPTLSTSISGSPEFYWYSPNIAYLGKSIFSTYTVSYRFSRYKGQVWSQEYTDNKTYELNDNNSDANSIRLSTFDPYINIDTDAINVIFNIGDYTEMPQYDVSILNHDVAGKTLHSWNQTLTRSAFNTMKITRGDIIDYTITQTEMPENNAWLYDLDDISVNNKRLNIEDIDNVKTNGFDLSILGPIYRNTTIEGVYSYHGASILFTNDTVGNTGGLSIRYKRRNDWSILQPGAESICHTSDELLLSIGCVTGYTVNKSDLSIKDKDGNSIPYKFVRYDGTIVENMTDQEILNDYGKTAFRVAIKFDRDIVINMKAEKEIVATYDPLVLEITNSSEYDGSVSLSAMNLFGSYPGFKVYHGPTAGGSETFVNIAFDSFNIDSNSDSSDPYPYGKTVRVIATLSELSNHGVASVNSVIPSFLLKTSDGKTLTGTISILKLDPSSGDSIESGEYPFSEIKTQDSISSHTIAISTDLFSIYSQTIVKINITDIE